MRRDGLVATLTPALSVGAYGSGDVMGAPMEIPEGVLDTKGLAILRTVVVLDKANQKAAVDLLIFDADPGNVGADNAALDLSATQLDMLIGRISVATGDYTTLKTATNAEATKLLEMLLPAKVKSKAFWVVCVSRGTPTYGSAVALTLKFSMERL